MYLHALATPAYFYSCNRDPALSHWHPSSFSSLQVFVANMPLCTAPYCDNIAVSKCNQVDTTTRRFCCSRETEIIECTHLMCLVHERNLPGGAFGGATHSRIAVCPAHAPRQVTKYTQSTCVVC